MATIGDVARRAGVSTTLVSRYLNGVKGVSPASKEKIEGAIRELNYVPDESARMLVRRRGGATPTPTQQAPIPAAIALVCEDIDFRLISSFYIGAKHAIWANEKTKDTRILIISIPNDEHRETEEDATLLYLSRICRGILCVGAADTLLMKISAQDESLPAVSVSAKADAKQLGHTSAELREFSAAMEKESADAVTRLCEKLAMGDNTVETRVISAPYAFRLAEEAEKDHSPVGRKLQSHLL